MRSADPSDEYKKMKYSLLEATVHAKNALRADHKVQIAALSLSMCAILACESTPPEPESRPTSTATKEVKDPSPKPAASAEGDPVAGVFTLAHATAGLAKEGKLLATIDTDLGALSCELFEDKAPITVANFVGLARGLRPFKHDGSWQKKPAYDGTTFHRIIKGFMIQGGDPSGNGSGEPGYVIPDEKWDGARHDQRGLLCMANRGPNTNGMQFFITDAAAPHLDNSYTIFGKCGPDALIETLASVETHGRNAGLGQRPDQPLTPPKIKSVSIERK